MPYIAHTSFEKSIRKTEPARYIVAEGNLNRLSKRIYRTVWLQKRGRTMR